MPNYIGRIDLSEHEPLLYELQLDISIFISFDK